jgi:hypothetical protein
LQPLSATVALACVQNPCELALLPKMAHGLRLATAVTGYIKYIVTDNHLERILEKKSGFFMLFGRSK